MPEWERVPLGDVLTRSRESVAVDPQQTYKQVTVRMKHKGVVLREEKSGASIGTTRQFLARPGQFIISSIDARNGANGLIPESLDGAIVTNDFWLFDVDHTRLEQDWLDLYSSTPDFVEACTAASEGTTNRVRLKEDRFLSLEIPLPPLPEQQRIVARVKDLLDKVEEATRLREKLSPEDVWASLLSSTFDEICTNTESTTFEQISNVVRGGSPRPAGDPTFYGGDIPFLRVADLTADDEIYLDEYRYSVTEAGLSKTRLVPAGTLMLTNSGATLGVPKICNFETTFNDGIQALLDINSEFDKEFLYFYLLSKTRWFREWAARGQGQPNLNTAMVKQLTLPVMPLVEQREVVSRLKVSQRLAQSLGSEMELVRAELQALPSAILAQAFAGAL